MSKRFWKEFHAAWGTDRGNGEPRRTDYDKEAWMYVQGKMQEYFKKYKEHTFRIGTIEFQFEWCYGPLIHVVLPEKMFVLHIRNYAFPVVFAQFKRVHNDPGGMLWKKIEDPF